MATTSANSTQSSLGGKTATNAQAIALAHQTSASLGYGGVSGGGSSAGTDRINGISVNPNVPNADGTPYSATTAAKVQSTAPQTAVVNPPNNALTNTQSQANPMTPTVPFNQAQAAITAAGQAGTLSTQDVAQATTDLKSKYNQGLQNANANLGTAPDTAGAASSGVNQSLPQTGADTTQAQAVIDDNKAHQQYLQDFQDSQTAQSQSESLVSEYQKLSDQLGLPALNTELMNMKNVINGTEQDIRDEVSKAGGFATNSQVLALATARNKTLIQNYNDLVQTRTDLTSNLNTMIGLEEKDKAFATQQIDAKLNFDQQQIAFADKAVANSQSALDSMQKSEGWDGIYKAAQASGDPQAIARINSTMGNGFDLATMATFDAATRATAATKTAQEQAQLAATLANTKATTAKTNVETAKLREDSGVPNPAKANTSGFNSQGVKYTVQSAAQEVTNHWIATNAQGSDGFVSPATYNDALAKWVANGLSTTDFKAEFGGYANPKDSNNKLINN